jgi:DNA-binding YbaB/EbfC family protein
MDEMQKEAEKNIVIGESGAGMIRVNMNGKHSVSGLKIDSSLLSEEKELLEDLIIAAINDAVIKVDKAQKDRVTDLTGGIEMPPGFKMPF